MDKLLIELYEAARTFKKSKWWLTPLPEEAIIFIHPQTKEIYFVHFVNPNLVRIHLGIEGLESYNDYEMVNTSAHQLEAARYVIRQNALEVSFVDRDEIHESQYEQIKSLGLSFRGAKQWPAFFKMSPGNLPEDIKDPQEVQFFAEILTVLARFLPKSRGAGFSDPYETYLFEKKSQDWTHQMVDFFECTDDLFDGVPAYTVHFHNELKVHRIKKLPQKPDLFLETNQFFMPAPIWEDDGAYFPLITFIANADTGEVVFHHVGRHSAKELEELPELIGEFLLHQLKARPQALVTDDEILFSILADFCQQSGISLLPDETPMVFEVAESMLGSGLGGPEDLDEESFFPGMDDTLLALVTAFDQLVPAMETHMENNKKYDNDNLELHLQFLINLVMGMHLEAGETFPHWSEIGFSRLLKSNVLAGVLQDQGLTPKDVQSLNPYLKKLLPDLEKWNILPNGKKLAVLLK